MSDIVDMSDAREQIINDARIANIRLNAQIPVGHPGICQRCEEDSMRLVNEFCATCRDKYKLG